MNIRRNIFLVVALFLGACAAEEETVLPEGAPANLEEARNSPQKISLLEAPPDSSRKIGEVFIVNNPISDETGWIPSIINFFHAVTTKETVRAELLFSENSETSVEELAESARLLRALPSTKDAEIVLSKEEDGSYTALVYTRDRITFNPFFNFAGSGGYTLSSVTFEESSLFGELYRVGLGLEQENFIRRVGVFATQPRFLHSRWGIGVSSQFSFNGGNLNNTAQSFYASKNYTGDGPLAPFERVKDRYSFYADASIARGTVYRFKGAGTEQVLDPVNNTVLDRVFGFEGDSWNLSFSRAFGRLDRLEFSGGMGQERKSYYFTARGYDTSTSPRELKGVSELAQKLYLPREEEARFVTAAIRLKSFRYLTRRNFRNLLFTEDHYRGILTGFKATYADPAFGLPGYFLILSSTAQYAYDQGNLRLETVMTKKARREIRDLQWVNDLNSIEQRAFYFTRLGTLAGRLYYAIGYHLDQDKLFNMGGTFVRGFPFKIKQGSVAYLGTIEYRTPPTRVSILALSALLFTDVGEVKKRNAPYSPEPVVGFGLRGNIAEFDNTLFRLDIGFPVFSSGVDVLNQMSFGLYQVF